MSKKLPTAVHEAAGTARADRQHDDEPQPDLGVPALPLLFDEDEIAVWDRCVDILQPLGVLTVADGLALEQLVTSIIECRDLKAKVKAAPTSSVTSTQKEQVDKVHVLYPMWNQARDRLIRLWSVFGLDPTARTSLHTIRPTKKSPSDRKPRDPSGLEKRKADYFAH